jgi:hypothetical protein
MYVYRENPPLECWECLQKDNRLGDVLYWFRAVIDQLYGNEEFDDLALEHYLNEVAGYLNIRLPEKSLAVTCKANSSLSEIEDWQQFNTNYFKELAKVGV